MKGFPYVFLNTGRTASCSPGPPSGRLPAVVTRAACPARPARTPVRETTRTPLPEPRQPCGAMAMFVHPTSAANAPRIRRSGVRTAGRGPAGTRGVHCFPVLPSHTLTHQWLRERARFGSRGGLVAVHVRPDAGGICRTRTAGWQHGSTAAQSPAAREPGAPEPGRPRSTAAALPGRPAAPQSGRAAARRPWRIARSPGSPCRGTRAAERAAAVNRPRISRAWRGWRCGRGRAGRARPCGCGPPPGSPRRTRRRGRTPATARATACAAGRWPRTSRPTRTACW